MFNNLHAEMARQGHNIKTLAGILQITPKSAGKKLSGKSDWTLSEMMVVKNIYPSRSLDYLFAINLDSNVQGQKRGEIVQLVPR
ncbi:MAG: hypothetical protein ACM3QW_10170 [Ignavibacteriales bacterium]